MKTRSLILLASAITLAAGAALVGRALMRPPAPVTIVKEVPVEVPAQKAPVRYVLTAQAPLEAGQFIKSETFRVLTWKEVPGDDVRADDYSAANDEGRRAIERDVYGAAVRQPLENGQNLTRAALVYPGEPGFLAAVITPGKRAVSIPINVVSSNSGLVNAGDRVDVILSLDRIDLDPPMERVPNSVYTALASQTIVRDVRVLAMNNNASSAAPLTDMEAPTDAVARRNQASRGQPSPKTLYYGSITLEVSTEDAERLALARQVGTMQVALLSLHDEDAPKTATRDVTRLKDATAVFDNTAPQIVNVFQGTNQTVQTYRSRP